MRRGWLVLAPMLFGCREDLGLARLVFACTADQDCARGTVCEPTTGVCRAPGFDAGAPLDAERDSGAEDHGRVDSGEVDGGEVDGGLDAGLRLRAVAAGREHTCAVEEGGTIQCWGHNDRGQLGYGTSGGASVRPVRVLHFTDFVEVGTGNRHSCGRRAGGGVHCWGSNQLGEAGWIANTDQPGSIPLFEGAIELAVGQYQSTCVRRSSSEVVCVGFIINGQHWTHEDGGDAGLFSPRGFHGPIARLTVGHQFMCAILEQGAGMECFGVGALGGTSSVATSRPALVPLPGDLRAGGAASGHACALAGTEVYCWGRADAALGLAEGWSGSPVRVELGAPAAGVSVGWHHSCALMADETVQCWGLNGMGQLGVGSESPRRPAVVPEVRRVLQLAPGGAHTCALTRDQQLLCWGSNSHGQLGRSTPGPFDPRPAPVEW